MNGNDSARASAILNNLISAWAASLSFPLPEMASSLRIKMDGLVKKFRFLSDHFIYSLCYNWQNG